MSQAKRVYSLQTKQKAIQAYESLKLTNKAVVKGVEISSISQLLQLFDIKNHSTLRHQLKQKYQTKEVVKKRLHNRGKKAELDREEQEDLKR